jgi:hypothetical protein
VADRVQARQALRDGRLVSHVRPGPQVELPYVVAALAQRLDDVGADEAGGAGHKYAHGLKAKPMSRDVSVSGRCT